MNIELNRQSFYIGGQWVKPKSEQRINVVNANTGEVIGRVPEGSEADIEAAVEAARKAMLGAWSTLTPQDRAALLVRLTDSLQQRDTLYTTPVRDRKRGGTEERWVVGADTGGSR